VQYVKKYKYIILGAGPSGLTFANKLLQSGEESFIVLEKESEAGGLCRSLIINDSPLDIGGGHFLDVKRKEVLDFLFSFLPKEEWQLHKRKSTIITNGSEIDYPFEANIWQLPIAEQIDYLLSISKTELGSKTMPKKFIDWIYWKLGDKIAKDYMIPYNKKMWSMDLNKLGTYWLYKLPDVSLRETLISCLTKKPAGQIPAHAEFLYPLKYGYGEVWKRMATVLGNHIVYNFNINSIDISTKTINNQYSGDIIINTIPWKEFKKTNIPDSIITLINKLIQSSIRISYYKEDFKSDAHWTYLPDINLPHHRVLNRSNFCPGSRGYWTEMNEKRSEIKYKTSGWKHINKYAYPINTLQKPNEIKKILAFFQKRNIYGLGRWGEWEHMNSDVAVERAISLFKQIYK
jgi:protoporphyrinogen oxidase